MMHCTLVALFSYIKTGSLAALSPVTHHFNSIMRGDLGGREDERSEGGRELFIRFIMLRPAYC